MSSSALLKLLRNAANFIEKPGIRHRFIRRGRSFEDAKSLEDKFKEWRWKDPELHYRVNIGYALPKLNRRELIEQRFEERRKLKNNFELEKAAKNKTLEVPVEQVHTEWSKTNGPSQIKEISEFFGIYNDLFEEAYFYPVLPLKIKYPHKDNPECFNPVYYGNVLKPFETSGRPMVEYPSENDDLFTILMTTPDCHFTKEVGEIVHWLVGNIPGNQLEKGKEVYSYLQPYPPRGIGYCRYIFIAFKQDKQLDFSKYSKAAPCLELIERDFSTYNFYKEFQDSMTPVGLSFFQADWDPSLTDFYHNVLNMKEPIFEYDFPQQTLKPQLHYPHNRPFNLYLDRYKEPKELQRELLLEKLKERHPFKPAPKMPKYPLAYKIPNGTPSWLSDEIRRKRAREGKWKYM